MELDMVTEDEEALEMLEAECTALRLASEHEKLRTRVVRLHEVHDAPISPRPPAHPDCLVATLALTMWTVACSLRSSVHPIASTSHWIV
eukprot:scaffold149881_cov34-Tisochrysis_lutea.AAC.2